MTVINVSFLSEAEILIGSDTLQYCGGKPVALTASKVHTGTGFALAQRGLADLCAVLIGTVSDAAGFDAAHDTIRAVVEADGDVIAEHAARHYPGFPAAHEAYLSGWSAAAGRMAVARIVVGLDGAAAETVTVQPGRTIVQPEPRPGLVVPAATRVQLLRLMEKQAELVRLSPGICIGGVMHITTVTRDGVWQEVAGVYPDYDQHAAMFGDPNAEAVAAFSSRRVAA